ncbi:hypothetical protein Tco_0360288 [Tanacetum coccineum]
MAPRGRPTRLNPATTPPPVTDPTTTTLVTSAQLQAMIDEGVTAVLAARATTRNGDDSHTSGTGVRRNERAVRDKEDMGLSSNRTRKRNDPPRSGVSLLSNTPYAQRFHQSRYAFNMIDESYHDIHLLHMGITKDTEVPCHPIPKSFVIEQQLLQQLIALYCLTSSL